MCFLSSPRRVTVVRVWKKTIYIPPRTRKKVFKRKAKGNVMLSV